MRLWQLEAEIDHQNSIFGGDIEELSEKLNQTQAEPAEQRQRFEEERKASLRISALQGWGTGLFVLGAILSVLGNALNC